MLTKEAIKERSPKLKWLAIAVQITSIFTTQLAVLHTAWNVWGLIACLTNPDPGPHFAAQCHVNNAGISVQAAYGILVGIGMAATCVVTSICSSAVVRAIKTAEREERTEVIV
ncbi:uncharacterized protein LOC124127545 [Haliotis rufescens]|uniref:uncharacterized protein LOC124127545 n=1 Tax=Haliotis rufescens TaxID=6454 RepID=UPI001EAF9EA7|nr:uncharacterized protein LOC124127545 [Haliotis rufescens]